MANSFKEITTAGFTATTPALLATALNAFLITLPSDVVINIQYTSFLQGANQRHNALVIYYKFQ
jgi:hypothetical protein